MSRVAATAKPLSSASMSFIPELTSDCRPWTRTLVCRLLLSQHQKAHLLKVTLFMQILAKPFSSNSEHCAADLYLPDGVAKPPVMVMAHGFAGERGFKLPAFAENFCQQGVAVLLFDYRCFGDSEGYLKLVPETSSWRNALPARIGLSVPWYSPLKNASKVECPALIIAATKDSLIPVSAVRAIWITTTGKRCLAAARFPPEWRRWAFRPEKKRVWNPGQFG